MADVRTAGSQPLDPALEALRRMRDASGATPLPRTSAEENRQRVASGHRHCSSGPDLASVEDRAVPGGAGAPDVRVRIYAPTDPVTATVVYLHGGGWFTGDLDYSDELCRFLTRDTGARVVSVDYRLAPDHPFPAPLDDAQAVLEWAAVEFGGPPLGVAGDSAGGNLAAAVLQRTRHSDVRVDFQVLVYPVVDSDFTRASYETCAQSFPLGRADLEHMLTLYVPDLELRTSPDVCPLRGDLSGLPPALVVVAGHDPLHDEGVAYAEAMRSHGGVATVVDHPTLCHGFLRFTGLSPTAARARDDLVRQVTHLISDIEVPVGQINEYD